MWSFSVFFIVNCLFIVEFVNGTSSRENSDNVRPLILTPLLESNKISEALDRSRVRPGIGNTVSFSGYFTVNKSCDSNLFFWFFPAQNNWESAPVLLWVQGGPGASSLSSLFQEMGPLTYTDTLGTRQYSWNKKNNLLFIDQPVGTGYSFTGKGCYAKNEADVGREMYSAVVQFFQMFSRLQRNKFFIAGHSYAGHFIPALGHVIHKNNPSARVKINLVGMMIGNGWMDALYQYDVGSQLYQLGLIDDDGRDLYYSLQDQLVQSLEKKEWKKAMELRGSIVYGNDVFTKYVGNVSVFNFLIDATELSLPYINFIQTTQIRKSLHVGNTNYSFSNSVVEDAMGVDPVLSVKPLVEELLEHYFIVFYTGQLDIICSYQTVANFLKALNFSGKSSFKSAKRQKWCVGDRQAGYFKGGHNLYDVMVRDAGHTVAFDQPQWAYELINTVTSGTPENPLGGLQTC